MLRSRRQAPVVDLRVVLDGDPAARLVLVEDLFCLPEHGVGAGLSFRGHVGDREKPSLQTVEVEDLLVVETRRFERAGAEEGTGHLVALSPELDFTAVRPINL